MVAVRPGAALGLSLYCCCSACLHAEVCVRGRSSESVPSGFMDAVAAAFDGCVQRALAAVATKVRGSACRACTTHGQSASGLGVFSQEPVSAHLLRHARLHAWMPRAH